MEHNANALLRRDADLGRDMATPVNDDHGPGQRLHRLARWVQIDIDDAAEDLDHLISPDERLRIAMARQCRLRSPVSAQRARLGGARDPAGGAVQRAGRQQRGRGVRHQAAGQLAGAAQRDRGAQRGAAVVGRRGCSARRSRSGRGPTARAARGRPRAPRRRSRSARRPAGRSRAVEPAARRRPASSSSSKSTGDQRRISPGRVSTSSSCSGVAFARAVEVHCFVRAKVPAPRAWLLRDVAHSPQRASASRRDWASSRPSRDQDLAALLEQALAGGAGDESGEGPVRRCSGARAQVHGQFEWAARLGSWVTTKTAGIQVAERYEQRRVQRMWGARAKPAARERCVRGAAEGRAVLNCLAKDGACRRGGGSGKPLGSRDLRGRPCSSLIPSRVCRPARPSRRHMAGPLAAGAPARS